MAVVKNSGHIFSARMIFLKVNNTLPISTHIRNIPFLLMLDGDDFKAEFGKINIDHRKGPCTLGILFTRIESEGSMVLVISRFEWPILLLRMQLQQNMVFLYYE